MIRHDLAGRNHGQPRKVARMNRRQTVALHFMHYNFCRIHRSLRVTPAMEAGITDHLSAIEDIVRLLERREAGLPLSDDGPARSHKES